VDLRRFRIVGHLEVILGSDLPGCKLPTPDKSDYRTKCFWANSTCPVTALIRSYDWHSPDAPLRLATGFLCCLMALVPLKEYNRVL